MSADTAKTARAETLLRELGLEFAPGQFFGEHIDAVQRALDGAWEEGFREGTARYRLALDRISKVGNTQAVELAEQALAAKPAEPNHEPAEE